MSRKTVLLADDVDLFLELEKTFLRRQDIRLLVAGNGREAIEIAERERPDLIFLDLYMPEMDGDECCRLIKAHPDLAAIPVVMVTQAGRDEDLARCEEAGCSDIVLKPINRHTFLSTARAYLEVADRAAPRVEARLPVSCGPAGEEMLLSRTLDIGIGGVFVESLQSFPVNTELTVVFELKDPPREINTRGRVAWINLSERRLKPHFPPGMGVEFLGLRELDIVALRAFVKIELTPPSSRRGG